MELDSCNSSDALLMNIFCHPGVLRSGRAQSMLGLDANVEPCFGYKARVPVVGGRVDRTEVDMLLGNLLVEAKLTESNFQKAEKRVLAAYRDFHHVFDEEQYPKPKATIIPTNFCAMSWRLMHCTVRSAYCSTREGQT